MSLGETSVLIGTHNKLVGAHQDCVVMFEIAERFHDRFDDVLERRFTSTGTMEQTVKP